MDEELEAVILGGANADDIENIILHNLLRPERNMEEPAQQFDLNTMMPSEIKRKFRFERNDIYRLARVLRIPNIVVTNTRNRISGITAFCILLKRLAYPNRLADLSQMFNLSAQSLSQIINYMSNFIIENHNGLLSNLQNLRWLNQERMDYYAQAVRAQGGAVLNCWGFIDGTARPICRPSVNQEDYYSGHKRYHCLKYQSVLCPDGIIASIKGAYPGRRHDAGIFRESNLYEELQQVGVFNNDQKFVLYGDQAYGIMELLLCPFPTRPNMPVHQQEFNNSMKVIRTAVEWGFQKIVSQFAFLDFRKNQKLLLQDLDTLYKVGVILSNCHTCLYGSQTTQYFNVIPPVLEVYVGNL